MADYSQLSTLITDAKREALIAEMTCNGWDFENDNVFKKFENYGESSAGQSVTLDGQAHGYSYNIGASNDNDEGLAQAALDEFNKVKSKWETNIDDTIYGWDSLHEPSEWNTIIDSLQLATQKVAAGTGNDDSQFGNPDLTEIGFIRQRLAQNAGQTVEQFYRLYGPEKLELVLDGHCEVMGCLGVVLTGEQKMWTAARQDVATILAASVEGFKQTRHNNSTSWESVITVVTAGVGLVGAFSAGVPGVAAAFAAASATGGFLSASLAALNKGKTEPEKKPYSGKHPNDVHRDLKDALRTLHERIKTEETGYQSSLNKMKGFVTDAINRQNFHIHPDAGLAKEFGGTDDVIDMKYPVLETIGYTSMPLISKAFLQSVDAAETGKDLSPWYRPYATEIGASIGLEAFGAYDEWESLLWAITPVMNDTAAEVLRAGEHLAEAAGYVKESDEWARTALGENYKDVEGAELGWQAPYTPPPPPPRRSGGPQPV